MRQADVFPSEYMKAAHLLDTDGNPMQPVIQVKKVKTIKYPDNTMARAIVFDMNGNEMTLGLNKTNWKSCALLAGKDPESCDDEVFVGLTIQLVRKMVEFKGDMVPAVRIQPVGGWDDWTPKGAAAETAKEKDELPF